MTIHLALARLLSAFVVAMFLMLSPGASAQQQPTPPATPPAVVTHDPIGEEVTLPARTNLYRNGNANWSEGWPRLVEAFKAVRAETDRLKLKVTSAPIVIYRSIDDEGFEFVVALPIETAPAERPGPDFAIGPGPSGKALKFFHRGAFDALDATYDLIADFLESKRIEAEEEHIEEYVTDPLATKPDELVIAIYVLLKK
jgi:effector-binding domain-containing protein